MPRLYLSKARRNLAICQRIANGRRGEAERLAKRYGISRQRIWEIYNLNAQRSIEEWSNVPALPGSEISYNAQIS